MTEVKKTDDFYSFFYFSDFDDIEMHSDESDDIEMHSEILPGKVPVENDDELTRGENPYFVVQSLVSSIGYNYILLPLADKDGLYGLMNPLT